MRSDHLLGMDIHSEYNLYQQVMNNLNWQFTSDNAQHFELLWPCISVSLLPVLLQSILQVNPEKLYIYYIPIFFSITPTIVYIIAKRYFNNDEAFFASVAFISYYSFFTASYFSRATFFIPFFALFTMVLFNDALRQDQKSIMLLLFSISMVLTHYSSTFIFLFIIGTLSIISYILEKKLNIYGKLTVTLFITVFAFTFLWYGLITDGVLKISATFVKSMFKVDDIYNKGAHNEIIYQLKGDVANYYISKLNLINTWLFLVIIGLGVLGLLLRTRYNWFKSEEKDRYVFLKKEFDPEFVIITVTCVIILAMTLILPYLSTGYDLNRIYFQVSVITSVVFIIGSKYAAAIIMKIDNSLKITKIIRNKNNYMETDKLKHIIMLAVLIPHLLFVANVPQQLTGSGDSIIFNSLCPTYDWLYIHDSDISCNKWWENFNTKGNHDLWADKFGAFQMLDQGHIESYSTISKDFNEIPETGYIYLRETNIVKNRIYYNYNDIEFTENFISREHTLNKIYSSPSAILYKTK